MESTAQDLGNRTNTIAVTTGDGFEYWSEMLFTEHNARATAEARAAQYAVEVDHLKEKNHLLREKVESLPGDLAQEVWELVKPLKAELEVLRSVHFEINPLPGLTCGRWPIRVLQQRDRWAAYENAPFGRL